ncbi:Bone morphogenetic protein [Trichinella spiralis]|uniref:Bone morphogenetic protein n=1 Tax=Trichinella spiralis TaxID=6334 RepID=A0ABR3KGX1_TRISP
MQCGKQFQLRWLQRSDMSHWRQPVTIAIWISLLYAVISCAEEYGNSGQQKPNHLQKKVLHNTFKALLNFHSDANNTDSLKMRASRSKLIASKYMKDLFEQYRMNAAKSKVTGNVVRSITPVIGTLNGDKVLIFNLNTVQSGEVIIKAELHFNAGQRKQRGRSAPICLLLSTSGERTVIRQIHRDPSGQWITYDLRNAIINAVHQRASADNRRPWNGTNTGTQLAIAFVGDSLLIPKTAKYYAAERILRHHTPFLLVFSDESRLVNPNEMMSTVLRENFVESDQTLANGRSEQSLEKLADQFRAFQQKGPEVLLPMRGGRRRDRPGRMEMNRGWANRRTRMNSKKRPHNRSTQSDKQIKSTLYNADNDPTVILLKEAQQQRCQKHNLIVDFRDIGWQERIIAPKSFEAHYCAGSCQFPLNWESNPSNHAIIQNIIHTIGFQPKVPQVCCSPDKMDSLTLLYFDEDQNVVLKTYPKMTVMSCGCV